MKRFPLLPGLPPKKIGCSRSLVPPDYTPVHWSKYFQSKKIVALEDGSHFCMYMATSTTKVDVPTIYFIHGGGFSALTWSLTVSNLMLLIDCNVVAIDLRGHGETHTLADYELTTSNLIHDMEKVARAEGFNRNSIVVIGHSLGGALAVHFVTEFSSSPDFHLAAIVVIDVVEGSALDSLTSMNLVLRSRPPSFPTLSRAIQWCVKSGVVHNAESARVSMPGQLKVVGTDEPATLRVLVDSNRTELPVKAISEEKISTLPKTIKPIILPVISIRKQEAPSKTNIPLKAVDCFSSSLDKKVIKKNTIMPIFENKDEDAVPEDNEEADNILVDNKLPRRHELTEDKFSRHSKSELNTQVGTILEEGSEVTSDCYSLPNSVSKLSTTCTIPTNNEFTWRIDLNQTQPHWKDWFEGISTKFLSISCPKYLLLAGVDRLDRELTVGQMQGKFQLQVLPNVGHAIQEDSPADVAKCIASFLVRHKLVTGKTQMATGFPAC